jgi:hypothetical protein
VADLKDLCLSLSQAWEDIVRNDNANDGHPQRNLSGVFVMRSIEALMEHGFILPEVSSRRVYLSLLHIFNALHRLGRMESGLNRTSQSSKSGQVKEMLIFKISYKN